MTTHFKALYTTTSLFVLISSISTAAPEIKGTGFIKGRLLQMCNRIGSWARQEDPKWDALIASFEEERARADQSLSEDFYSSVPQYVKKKTVQEEDSEPLSLRTALNGLMRVAHKGARYALKHPLQALTLGLLAGRVTPAAAWSSDEFRIDQSRSSSGYAPIARMNDNTAILVWGSVGGTPGVVTGRRYAPNGTELGPEFPVGNVVVGLSPQPGIANVNGNAFVVWDENDGEGRIRARVLFSDGSPRTGVLDIYTMSSSFQSMPAIANVNNNAFIVWRNSGSFNIYFCTVSPDGVVITNPSCCIHQNILFNQQYPSIEAMGGYALVAWDSDHTGARGVYGRSLFQNGTASGPDFCISPGETFPQIRPQIARLTSGNALVSWAGRQTTGYDNAYGQEFSMNGTALGNRFRIDPNSTLEQSTAATASLPNGIVLAVWLTRPIAGGSYEVCGRTLSSDGAPLSEVVRISQGTGVVRSSPSLAIIDGRAFISWQVYDALSAWWHVTGRSIDPADFFTSTTSSTTTETTTTSSLPLTSLTRANSSTTTEATATSRIIPSTSLTRANSSTSSPTTFSTRPPITTEIESSSSLPPSSPLPRLTEKENHSKKILIGTGVGAASLVALTAGAVLAKKYRSSKKDKVASDPSHDKSTFSSNSFPLNGIPHDNYGRKAVVAVPTVNGGTIETPYGLASLVRPPDNSNSIYDLTPNVRPDDPIYAPTPVSPKAAVFNV